MEHQLRVDAIGCAEQLGTTRAASTLGLSARTLRHWRHEQRTKQLQPIRRGRPTVGCEVAVRNEVIRLVHHVTGPSVGLPAIRCLFPQVRRCILENLLVRYRRVWRRRYRKRGFVLSWHHAGAVWAMDHSEPTHPVDGIYPYLLAVRDLASSRQLAWHPVHTVTAEETLPLLEALFSEHGPPLVLKSDNGSAFIAEHLHHALNAQQIAQLFSPARRPAYNGALERSNGVLKTYTHQQAVAAGHPLRWTSHDLDQAMQLANTISRPWGHRGPTPEQVWQSRQPISPEQRADFLAALARHRAQAVRDLGLAEHDASLGRVDQSRRDRLALSRALEELGYLTMRRVHRAPKKPKRLSREKLKQRADRYRRDAQQPARAARWHKRQLAQTAPTARMRDSVACTRGDVDRHRASQATASARRERTIPSWLRRFITLLVSFAKTAKITR